MMKKLLCAVMLSSLISAPALAAEKVAKPAPEIDPALCRSIAEYQKPAGVDYKPGVDVHGKPVVEADLNPSPVKMPENFSFDVTIDTAQYLGLPTPGLEGVINVGTITSEKGKLSFNGEPMDGHAAKVLRELCTKKPEIPVETPAPAPAEIPAELPPSVPDIHIQ